MEDLNAPVPRERPERLDNLVAPGHEKHWVNVGYKVWCFGVGVLAVLSEEV